MTIDLPHLAESEYREPLFVFSPPAWLQNETVTLGFFWISELYWIEVLGLVCLNMVLSVITGVITFKCIVEPKKCDTVTAFTLGLGILLPFWIIWPTVMYQTLDLRNLIIKFVVGGVQPTLMQFRLLETIFGCCPPHATTSLSAFLMHFASVLVFARDDESGTLLPATTRMTILHLRQFICLLFVTGAFQSMLTPYPDFNVFGAPVDRGYEWFGLDRMATWQLYANSFLHAVLFQLYLTTYCEGLTFFWFVTTGYQTMPVMKNPLLGGVKSPSDFWGRKWNLLVQSVLKGGVYKPMRKYGYSPTMAVVGTFVASGLFHEWLVYGLFTTACLAAGGTEDDTVDSVHRISAGDYGRDSSSSSSCYHPTYGGAMIFFFWQAMLIAGEFLLGNDKNSITFILSKKVPLPVRTVLIIAMGIPVAHFFTEPYVRSNYFRHGQMGLPMILRVDHYHESLDEN